MQSGNLELKPTKMSSFFLLCIVFAVLMLASDSYAAQCLCRCNQVRALLSNTTLLVCPSSHCSVARQFDSDYCGRLFGVPGYRVCRQPRRVQERFPDAVASDSHAVWKLSTSLLLCLCACQTRLTARLPTIALAVAPAETQRSLTQMHARVRAQSVSRCVRGVAVRQ